MTRGVCVFDLDSTLGDFRIIDFFGMIYEPKIITEFINKKEEKSYFKSIINLYSNEEYDFLTLLRDTFEKTVHEKGLDEGILRPNLKDILSPLVEQYKKHKIQGFIIYSNNGNLYALEYAGRSIQNMFHTPKLFLKYLDRYSTLRDKYDGEPEGARSKMVNTIKQIVPSLENKHLLFMDDIVHNDFYTTLESTYILVPPYESNAPNERLEELWGTFEEVFNSFDTEQQKMFFNLYHIKNYLKVESLNQLRTEYLQYSKRPRAIKPFHENISMIHEKIHSYIMKLAKVGGKRNRTRRIHHINRTKRRKQY
jgi:hypothetical protein